MESLPFKINHFLYESVSSASSMMNPNVQPGEAADTFLEKPTQNFTTKQKPTVVKAGDTISMAGLNVPVVTSAGDYQDLTKNNEFELMCPLPRIRKCWFTSVILGSPS